MKVYHCKGKGKVCIQAKWPFSQSLFWFPWCEGTSSITSASGWDASPSILSGFPDNMLAPIYNMYTPGWREAL